MNVSDIRNKEGLYFALDSRASFYDIDCAKAVIIVYLYYIDTIEDYLNFISKIDSRIALVFITASLEVKLKIETLLGKRENFEIRLKENRGRDVAALLVTAKDLFEHFEFLCFLHDKKEKNVLGKNDTRKWTINMWGNLIASTGYIQNVINLLEDRKDLGLLLPMVQTGDYQDLNHKQEWRRNGRDTNYEIIKNLIKKVELNCELDYEKPVISFGTMFWCRTTALRKLVEVGWNLEDFPEEPLADDGTISHAIERIFPYVAQDSGYKTASIMTDSFVGKYLGRMQELDSKLFYMAEKYLGVRSPLEIEYFEWQEKRLRDFCTRYERIYLYGAGVRGDDAYYFLTRILNVSPLGYIDRKLYGEKKHGLRIYSLDEIKTADGVGIIVSMGFRSGREVETFLKRKGYRNVILYVDSQMGLRSE